MTKKNEQKVVCSQIQILRELTSDAYEFMAYCGTLIESMETHYVNGFAYNTIHPVPESEVPQR
ncbi:MAG: hypothetical protein ACLPOA_17785, partial [Methylocella sp.]